MRLITPGNKGVGDRPVKPIFAVFSPRGHNVCVCKSPLLEATVYDVVEIIVGFPKWVCKQMSVKYNL